MRRLMIGHSMLSRAFCSLLACALLAGSARAQSANSSQAGKSLHALFAAEWDYEMAQHPTWASTLGDRRWNDRWDDISLAAIEKRHAHDRQVLAKLKTIDRAALAPADRLNLDLFLGKYQKRVEGFQYGWHLLPLNQLDGVQTVNQLAEALRFETVKDYDDWLARLRALPVKVKQTIVLMRQGMREGLVHPKIVLRRVPAQIDHQIVADAKASPLYKPFTKFPSAVTEAARSRLAKAAQEVIAASVVPAYRELKDFIVQEYLPKAPEQVGIWQFPRGEAMYRGAISYHTTTDLTPREIHELGLSEVSRIRAEMERIIEEIGFKGTFREFAAQLRADGRFYYRSEEELLDGYRAMSRRIDPLLVKLFGILPRMPYGIEAMPSNTAPDSPAAFYRGPAADGSRAGTFLANVYKPEIRPKYEMMALTLHEAVPGHHLQFALAMEQRNIPRFRRHGGYTAFIEGWALYAESLGYELGLYDDPYAKFGQLIFEIWRAARLVVDTGIHELRWDRQRAIDFMVENTVKQELEIAAEIDRYIVWPGQALAYKIGQLKISELRAKAKKSLGGNFDIRAFHDELLRDGPLPLDRLEAKLNAWIAAQARRNARIPVPALEKLP